MIKIEAKKDGKGNIVITENSFEMLLACLDNQKFVHEAPKNGDTLAIGEEQYKTTQKSIQDYIDEYNKACRKILHQKLIIAVSEDGYYLVKSYDSQDDLIDWSFDDVLKIRELFKDTEIPYKRTENLLPLDGTETIMKGTIPIGKDENGFIHCEPTEKTPWLIERSAFKSKAYLTISEDGKENRRWEKEELENIKNLFTT
jgi:hypothetical protein